jgi:hypothetical protein
MSSKNVRNIHGGGKTVKGEAGNFGCRQTPKGVKVLRALVYPGTLLNGAQQKVAGSRACSKETIHQSEAKSTLIFKKIRFEQMQDPMTMSTYAMRKSM